MRLLTKRKARVSSVHALRAVALLWAAIPFQAFGGEPVAETFGTVMPLSDQAFSIRAGGGKATPPAFSSLSRVNTVRASVNVFAYRDEPVRVEPPRELTTESVTGAADETVSPGIGDAGSKVRPDLLAGMPDDVARLIVHAAREEGVDPNLMLSIARAENGSFDPEAVSGAGAIGLMQMLPETGAAFGAEHLTDPVQNVRASAKFLKVLVDKYANPVLVAAAYNAGEPKVDMRTSLPLIRETADYVTRVVGLYTHAYAPGDIEAVGRLREGTPSSGKRRMEKPSGSNTARSSMLVFSANEPAFEGIGAVEQIQDSNGPLKVREEGGL